MSDDPGQPSRGDHYSYSAYADPRMAETFESARFSGPIGRMLAETQEQVIASFLAPLGGRTVLDVGTGTGRAAIALARRGAVVTGLDASAEMLAVAERRAGEQCAPVTFVTGDAHALAFPPRSFDAVVCLRVLMHTPDWRRSLGELCRVARHRLVVDYPALSSAAALQAASRHVAHRFGASVEAYRVFSDRAFRQALEQNGFRILDSHRQFVLPIALHKAVGSARATSAIERALGTMGLRWMFGSPVTIVAERTGDQSEALDAEAAEPTRARGRAHQEMSTPPPGLLCDRGNRLGPPAHQEMQTVCCVS
ncbi:MAG: class I SAM-dependent methyltransferase [Burkholderiales bacterium]